ncbi:MAG: M16 family metallopeptidase [Planctomycetota bacterium]
MPAGSASSADVFSEQLAPGGVPLHLWQTQRFRSVLLLWVVEAPLDEGRAARALLPDLLTRGTRRSPGMAEMAARCEELYGAELFAQSVAVGDRQLLQLGFLTVADRLAGGRKLFAEAVDLLAEALHDPPLVSGRFRADHLEQERSNLQRAIEALADDTGFYAYRRMLETMHGGTPRALHHWGRLEDVAKLDEARVHAAWDELRLQAPAQLLIAGDVSLADAERAAERLGGGAERRLSPGPVRPPRLAEQALRTGHEARPLAQSKLVMGFRIAPELLAGSAARLFGDVLGGESHSRLFKRIREAESLAYGCNSTVQTEHATLVVQAGIDAASAPRVRALVEEEVARLAQTPPPAAELELSRRSLLRDLVSLQDTPRGACGFRLAARMLGRPSVPAQAMREVEAVTPAQISAVAAACRLDTLFLLEGTGTPEPSSGAAP